MSEIDTTAMREKYRSQAMHAIAGNFIPDITALCDALDALRSWADGAKVDIEGLTMENTQLRANYDVAAAGHDLCVGVYTYEEATNARDAALAEVEGLKVELSARLADQRDMDEYDTLWFALHERADAAEHTLSLVQALLDDPGGPDTWSFTHNGRHGLYADDIRQALRGTDG